MRIPSNAEKEGYLWQIPLDGGHQQRIRVSRIVPSDAPTRQTEGLARSIAVSFGHEQRKAMFSGENGAKCESPKNEVYPDAWTTTISNEDVKTKNRLCR